MSNNKYFVEDFFNKCRNDKEYREFLLKNPKQAMCELHGVDPKDISEVNFKVIKQDPDTITIMIPSRPTDYLPEQTSRVKEAADRAIDLMYTKGIPGFLIPNNNLRWTLLNMRRSWLEKEYKDVSKN